MLVSWIPDLTFANRHWFSTLYFKEIVISLPTIYSTQRDFPGIVKWSLPEPTLKSHNALPVLTQGHFIHSFSGKKDHTAFLSCLKAQHKSLSSVKANRSSKGRPFNSQAQRRCVRCGQKSAQNWKQLLAALSQPVHIVKWTIPNTSLPIGTRDVIYKYITTYIWFNLMSWFHRESA